MTSKSTNLPKPSVPETISPTSDGLPKGDEQAFELEREEFVTGQQEGRYQLNYEIARGGTGIVICTFDRLLRRQVAVKLLLSRYRDQPRHHHRFLKEALLTSRLQHPCIIPVYDRGYMVDSRPFFAMKLIRGQSLSTFLASRGSQEFSRLRLIKIFEQICHTVSYAHSQGILHLDIKPANIMIGDFGEVLLMDWGQAKSWTPSANSKDDEKLDLAWIKNQENPMPRGCGGTPAYMSPEHARGEGVFSAADVFALGALLYEILVGHPPYTAAKPKQILKNAIRCNTDQALADLDSSRCDGQLVSIVKRCLAKDPFDRPNSANAVALLISSFLESSIEQADNDRCRFFDLTLDIFCIASLQGFFIRVNANFPKVLGYSEQILVSKPYLEFVHPDDIQRTRDAMKGLLEGKPIIQFCNRYRHADGHYLIFEWTAQSLPSEGNIFAVARDVTARNQTFA